jgi:hypothetical protein
MFALCGTAPFRVIAGRDGKSFRLGSIGLKASGSMEGLGRVITVNTNTGSASPNGETDLPRIADDWILRSVLGKCAK